MLYKYPDGEISCERSWVYNNTQYTWSWLTPKPSEAFGDEKYVERINGIGVYPVRYALSPHTPPQEAQGPAVGAIVDGWWEISYPVPIKLIECWSKTNKEGAWLPAPVPDTHTTQKPPDICYEWDIATNTWVCMIAANTAMDKAKRDIKLDQSQWMVNRHRDQVEASIETSLAPSEYVELLTFRQALRDLPTQDVDSRNWVWPPEPSFIVYKAIA